MINWPMDGNSVMKMRRSALIGAAAVGLLFLSRPVAAQENKIDLKPLSVGASLYFGQMFNIDSSLNDAANFNPTLTLPYTSFWMVQNANVNERLHLSLGIAGSFFYQFPENNTDGWTSGRSGGIGIATAVGSYDFGNLESPWLQVSVGQQGYKYNPYAKNFGEYLFRSEAYPTTVRTGDWGAIDNAGAGIWGIALKSQFHGGLFKNDIIISMANERAPLHDMSVTDIASLNIGKVFSIGGGVQFSRLIQLDPAKSKPARRETGWFTWTAADQAKLDAYIQTKSAADPAYVANSDNFKRKTIQVVGGVETLVTGTDTALVVGQDYWAASSRPLVKWLAEPMDSTYNDAKAAGVGKQKDIQFVDTRTTFLMGRMSFDPKPLLGLESMGPMDLVLYGEMSVIGLDNYPIFYSKVQDRMPMMAGFYLPTFNFLDYLTVEVEQFKNPYLNSDFRLGYFREIRPKSLRGTLPANPDIGDPYYDKAEPGIADINHTEDDIKYTLTAAKSFGVWSLAFQYGKDHFRPLTSWFRPSFTEAATTSDAKYYMVRLMVNL